MSKRSVDKPRVYAFSEIAEIITRLGKSHGLDFSNQEKTMVTSLTHLWYFIDGYGRVTYTDIICARNTWMSYPTCTEFLADGILGQLLLMGLIKTDGSWRSNPGYSTNDPRAVLTQTISQPHEENSMNQTTEPDELHSFIRRKTQMLLPVNTALPEETISQIVAIHQALVQIYSHRPPGQRHCTKDALRQYVAGTCTNLNDVEASMAAFEDNITTMLRCKLIGSIGSGQTVEFYLTEIMPSQIPDESSPKPSFFHKPTEPETDTPLTVTFSPQASQQLRNVKRNLSSIFGFELTAEQTLLHLLNRANQPYPQMNNVRCSNPGWPMDNPNTPTWGSPFQPQPTPTTVKQVWDVLRSKGPLTAPEIATAMSIPLNTVWTHLAGLQEIGAVAIKYAEVYPVFTAKDYDWNWVDAGAQPTDSTRNDKGQQTQTT